MKITSRICSEIESEVVLWSYIENKKYWKAMDMLSSSHEEVRLNNIFCS